MSSTSDRAHRGPTSMRCESSSASMSSQICTRDALSRITWVAPHRSRSGAGGATTGTSRETSRRRLPWLRSGRPGIRGGRAGRAPPPARRAGGMRRPLGQRQPEAHLRPLAAREGGDRAVRGHAQSAQPSARPVLVPHPVEPRAERDVLVLALRRSVKPAHILGQVAESPARNGSDPSGDVRRAPRPVPVLPLARPTRSRSSVVLPAPFGPTSAVTRPSGTRNVQSLQGPRSTP